MYTLNKILEQFELFQQNHKQLNSFFFGSIPEVVTAEMFPMLYCQLRDDSGTVDVILDGSNFDFGIWDQPNSKDDRKRNVQEILSDNKLIARDFIAFLRYTDFGTPIRIELPVNINAVDHILLDDATGWNFPVNIKVVNELDLCSIPMTGYVPPEDYNKVRIRDIETGEILYRIQAGQDFFIEQLREILDTIDSNNVTITDPLT